MDWRQLSISGSSASTTRDNPLMRAIFIFVVIGAKVNALMLMSGIMGPYDIVIGFKALCLACNGCHAYSNLETTNFVVRHRNTELRKQQGSLPP